MRIALPSAPTTLPISVAALFQHVIILGKTGAGKSSTMRLLVESLLTDSKPVCIIDPKGDWWGLKSSASGKQAGFPVIIFGGDHADIPLTVHAGAYVAELVATGNRPCIIDLGGWTVGDRTQVGRRPASKAGRVSGHRSERWKL
jgi:DNA helicase HerA-like ATPase